MANFLILRDSRQQKERHIIRAFDKQKILHVQTKLDSADYMTIRQRGGTFYFDYSTLIDTKKDLLEVCSNLCHTEEHARVVREIEKAKELGCTDFIFLIGEKNIKSLEDIKKWSSPHTKVAGETLLKAMATFSKHHNCRFMIVPKKGMGDAIIRIFDKK